MYTFKPLFTYEKISSEKVEEVFRLVNEMNVDNVYLVCGSTDLRKSINGLAALVKEVFNLDPFSSSVFVFCNQRRDKLKIIYWDHNGFWLFYRRLEQGFFQWPKERIPDITKISRRQLRWLLDGLPLNQTQAHSAVTARILL